jgi:acetolactate synthase-1/2/3 large subunit
MNAANWLVRRLQQGGVERIFALCGNGLDPFFDACFELGMPVIDVRNEQTAAYMADTWGRMTGSLGVVAVSSGPGHTNALTGLANAFWDGGPMLLISGCSPLATRGLDHFQELDQVGMVTPVTKYAALVQDVRVFPQQVETALQAALAGRPGPVHLTLPVDILLSEVESGPTAGPLRVAPGGLAAPADVERAVALLAEARRPLMVVGSGAFYARAWQPLKALAALTDIPMVSHIWDRGCIEEALPQYLGVTNDELNGAMGRLPEVDCLVTVGARIDYRLGHGQPPTYPHNAKLIRLDAEPAELVRHGTPDVALAGDIRANLEQILALAERKSWHNDAWLASLRASQQALLGAWEGRCCDDCCPVPPLRLIRELVPFLGRDVTFLLDGGNIGRWAHMALFDRHPSHWFTCGASGVVGWGLGGAMAGKLARPDRPLLLLSGDGAAGFNVSDIETALRFRTPFVMVVAHDGAWGIVADGQPAGRRVACELGTLRFDRVAQALGARGVLIEDPRQIGPAIEEGLAADTVTVIQVPTQQAGIAQWVERFG